MYPKITQLIHEINNFVQSQKRKKWVANRAIYCDAKKTAPHYDPRKSANKFNQIYTYTPHPKKNGKPKNTLRTIRKLEIGGRMFKIVKQWMKLQNEKQGAGPR